MYIYQCFPFPTQIFSGRHSQGDTISLPLEDDGVSIIFCEKKEGEGFTGVYTLYTYTLHTLMIESVAFAWEGIFFNHLHIYLLYLLKFFNIC